MASGEQPGRVHHGQLHLDVQRFPDGLALGIAGELDLAGCDAMRSVFDGLVQERLHRIVVNLSDLEFTDSTGLGVLVRAHKQAQAAGTEFAVVCPHGRIRDLFALTQLTDVLHVVATLEEALTVETTTEEPPHADVASQELPLQGENP